MSYPPPPGNQSWPQPQQPGFYPPYQPSPPTNTMAIIAIVSAFVISPLGIVFGHIALSQIRRTGEDGRVLAIIGLVVGYVSTALLLLVLVFWIVMFAWFANEIDNLPTTTPTYGSYSMRP